MYGIDSKASQNREFYEQSWRRNGLAKFDAIWADLSVAARLAFLEHVKVPTRPDMPHPNFALVSAFPPGTVAELEKAGLVTVVAPPPTKAREKEGSRVYLVPEAREFGLRIKHLDRTHLLEQDNPNLLMDHFNTTVGQAGFFGLKPVLQAAKLDATLSRQLIVQHVIRSRKWPDWVVETLKDPIAGRIIRAVDELPPVTTPEELLKAGAANNPEAARETLDRLIGHMALAEGLHPETRALEVSFLPAVWYRREAARTSKGPPELAIRENPPQLAPHAGLLLNDLRGFLIDLAGQPIRLKTDDTPFVKEAERLVVDLEPWPDWLSKSISYPPTTRLTEILETAADAGFVKPESDREGRRWLKTTREAASWLAKSADDQFTDVYEVFRAIDQDNLYYGDSIFFGTSVAVTPRDIKKKDSYSQYGNELSFLLGSGYSRVTKADVAALRESYYRALSRLPMGKYVRLDTVLPHLVNAGNNPILIGREPGEVTIRAVDGLIPPIEEALVEAAKVVMMALLAGRLIPYEAVLVGCDDDGMILIARTPRLDLYFGHEPTEVMPEMPAAGPTKVIIQPDFSVLIIGLDPTPAVELAPFCERIRGRSGQGALTYKITRDSVIKAIAGGLPAKAVMERLTKHATIGLPDNVAREVKDWSGWIRSVTEETLTLIRCPDSDTADRAIAALGKGAERIAPTLVGLPVAKLSLAERQKLQAKGIIIGKAEKPRGKAASPSKKGAAKGSKRKAQEDDELDEILDDGW